MKYNRQELVKDISIKLGCPGTYGLEEPVCHSENYCQTCWENALKEVLIPSEED